jgi:palmitoyltransferase
MDDIDDDVQLYIEYKYCTICHIEQPLRCKHCKTCGYCVATHDHHCPWIGNCVGERNKFWFFWFIQTQFLQLVTGFAIAARVITRDKESFNQLPELTQLLLLFSFLVCLGFALFVLTLVIFHGYLVSVNLTSWEFLSWMRITYLKVWPKKYGSPFTQGLRGNWKIFCYNFRNKKQCYLWTMPTSLPRLKD